jgi:GntR family transcriptional regulator
MYMREKEVVGPPLYYQVEESIRKRIENGTFLEGEKIPPEAELEKEFNVSRITVRKAVDNLVQDGLLKKQRGVGTLVTRNLIRDEVHSLEGFTEKMEKKGRKVSSVILGIDRLVPPNPIANALKTEPSEEVLRVIRLRMVDGIPLAIFNTYIPISLGIFEYEDFSHSLFDVYAKHGITPSYSDRSMHAVMVDAHTAHLLQMKDSLAALQMNYCTFDNQDRPIEYAEGIYRGDLYYYKMRVYRTFCDVAGGELNSNHESW